MICRSVKCDLSKCDLSVGDKAAPCVTVDADDGLPQKQVCRPSLAELAGE